MCFFLLIFLCVNFALLAADSHVSDVQIMYVSGRCLSFRYAHFERSAGVEVECMDGCRRNICDVFEDQLLAAYSFKPDAPKNLRDCPELWNRDVRKRFCYWDSFFSPEIRTCFDALAQASSVSLCRRIFNKKLKAKHVPQYIYPEGMTRRWSVHDKASLLLMAFPAEIVIFFKGRDEALFGEAPFRESEEEDVELSPRSLLCLKRGVPALETPEEQPLPRSDV